MSDLESLKYFLPLAVPAMSNLIEIYLKPKLQEVYQNRKVDREIVSDPFLTMFDGYLTRTYSERSYIKTLVAPNQKLRLESLYLSLTVVSQAQGQQREIRIDEYKDEFLPENQKVLLKDTAGMGKSTLLQFLFLKCIEQEKGIPIFVDLRRLKEELSIVDLMVNDINSPFNKEQKIDREVLEELIGRGDFVFFLDGYDEVAKDKLDIITTNINDFINKASKNYFLMSSRDFPALSAFPSFVEFSIKPLTNQEAFELIRKYDLSGENAERLISELQGNNLEKVESFLVNPLLVSLLVVTYAYSNLIPSKKHIFYRQVYDALFYRHDLTKIYSRPKYSKLESDDFHKVTRRLSFFMLKTGLTELEKDPMLKLISDAQKAFPHLSFSAADFLRDLTETVPLLKEDGFAFRWAHKSIGEYFAAHFIYSDIGDKRNQVLLKFSESIPRYYVILDLYYDLDYITFRHTIIFKFIDEFIKHYKLRMSLYEGVEQTENINWENADKLASLSFLTDFFLVSPEIIKSPNPLQKVLAAANESRYDIRTNAFSIQGSGVVRFNDFTAYKGALLPFLMDKGDDLFSTCFLGSEYVRKIKVESSREEILSEILGNRKIISIEDAIRQNPDLFTNLDLFYVFGIAPEYECMDYHKCLALKSKIEAEIAEDDQSELFGSL